MRGLAGRFAAMKRDSTRLSWYPKRQPPRLGSCPPRTNKRQALYPYGLIYNFCTLCTEIVSRPKISYPFW